MQLARTRVLYFWFLCTVLYTNEKKLIARGNPIFKQLKTSGLLADLAYPQKTAAFLFKFPLYQNAAKAQKKGMLPLADVAIERLGKGKDPK